MSQGKTPADACTIILSAFRVCAPIHPEKEFDHAKLLALVERPYSKKAKPEKPEPVRPQKGDQEKPAPAPKTGSKKRPSESVVEEALRHVRAVLDLPFTKEKKQEIILDLLDELL